MRADAYGERKRFPLESSERRVARFTFDLEEGPLQTVAALADDVRHFRSRLSGAAVDRDRRLLGCVDDLEARLTALDAQLRELMHAHLRP